MVKKWEILFTSRAVEDSKKLKSANLHKKTDRLISILYSDPFQNPPQYKKLIGELAWCYSRRINIQHRLVYQVDSKKHLVKVVGMFGHYEK
jgi:Txe/YoeB family toxin of toxin-antitoxin system